MLEKIASQLSYAMAYISAMTEGCVRSNWCVFKQYYTLCC